VFTIYPQALDSVGTGGVSVDAGNPKHNPDNSALGSDNSRKYLINTMLSLVEGLV
jgi:hypothetical protein